MPARDGTGRLGRGKNCNTTARSDRMGRGRVVDELVGRRGRRRRRAS